jgi:hypothetical protein
MPVKQKRRPKTYQKPLSLHPMKFEDAVKKILQAKPIPKNEATKK